MAKKPIEIGAKYIEIVIDGEGQTVVEAHGFNGKGCREATRAIEETLGRVSNRKDKQGPDCQQTVKAG